MSEATKCPLCSQSDMTDRHTKIAMQLQYKAIEALNRIDRKALSGKEIVELLRLGVELERINR